MEYVKATIARSNGEGEEARYETYTVPVEDLGAYSVMNILEEIYQTLSLIHISLSNRPAISLRYLLKSKMPAATF